MSSPDRGVLMPDPPRRRSVGTTVGWTIAWIVVGVMVVGLIGVILLGVILESAFPEYPDLRRPAAVLEGSAEIRPDSDPTTVTVDLAVSWQAVEAAASGDGRVHLELDVAEATKRPVEVEVGVAWPESAAAVRPLAAVTPGADVRWTLACTTLVPCEGVLDLTFGPTDQQEDTVNLDWRLVAEVRPSRDAEVSEQASLVLALSEASE
jgi:hypothetical protein